MAHPSGQRDLVEQTASKEPMALDSSGGRVHVRWSPDEVVSPFGQLPFFIDVLKQADLFESICRWLSVAVQQPERTRGPGCTWYAAAVHCDRRTALCPCQRLAT